MPLLEERRNVNLSLTRLGLTKVASMHCGFSKIIIRCLRNLSFNPQQFSEKSPSQIFNQALNTLQLVKSDLSSFMLHATLINLSRVLLTLQCLMSTKRSYILKQTCSFQLHVCLSMCDILMNMRHKRVKEHFKIGPNTISAIYNSLFSVQKRDLRNTILLLLFLTFYFCPCSS